jgi:hypothetical protein
MSSVIRHITLDANNPYTLGAFWESVLGWPMHPESRPGDGEVPRRPTACRTC